MDATTHTKMVSALAAQCPALAAVQRRYGAPPPSRRPADLATLVRIILEQQISIRAADTIYRRLRAGLGRISATALVAAGEPTLRGYGLTRQKAHYCAELGRAIRQRRFSITGVARLADDDALAALSTLKGIGPWSAAIYLMMALGRPDIWPPGDLALDRAARQLVPHGPDDPVELARRWSPYRSIAADYLWHYYRQTNGLQNRLIVNVD